MRSKIQTTSMLALLFHNAQLASSEDQETPIAVLLAKHAQLVKLPTQAELLVLSHKNAHAYNTDHQMDTHAQTAQQDNL